MRPAPRPRAPHLTALLALSTLGLLLFNHSLRKGRGGKEANPDREASRAHELDDSVRLAHRREQERHRLAVGVSRGRMPLPEAAARWMALHRQAPLDLGKFRDAHAGTSDEERYCRGMIELVTDLLSDEDPCSAQAVRGQLERELDGLLRRGPLSLPDPGLLLEK
ncbi:MAG: hypothetical protein U0797_17570 [Gemmataceae bacterium]